MLIFIAIFLAISHRSTTMYEIEQEIATYKPFTNPGLFDGIVPTLFQCTEMQKEVFLAVFTESLIMKSQSIAHLISFGPKFYSFFGGNESDASVPLYAAKIYSNTFIHKFNVTCTTLENCKSRIGSVDRATNMIELCPAYFDLQTQDYNSPAGYLINLETQLTGRTTSRYYNPKEVKQLAKINAKLALSIAESYQYFAESLHYGVQ